MKMARTPSLASMSVEALLKLRDNVGKVLSQKAVQLEQQLSKLGGEVRSGRRSSRKGQKVPVKYRDKEGNTWAGRGAQPVWLREKLKAGAKLARRLFCSEDSGCSQSFPKKSEEAPQEVS